MSASPLLRPGGSFGPYRVDAELGRGGQGALYRACHTTLEQDVALKVLFSPDRASHKRFLQEGQVLARLRHPNIVEVRDAGEVKGVPYLAMELIEGETLHALVLRTGKQPPESVLAILEQISCALHTCHTAGVVHRDLKPENVMIEAGTGRPVLLDFGLVKRDSVKMELGLDGRSQFSVSGEYKGTPVYMAPEQIDPSFGEVGPRTDVYALGALLYVLLTGHPPFDGRVGMFGVFSRVLELLPPLDDSAGTPRLRALCLRALAKEPALRPKDADEFAQALRAATRPRASRALVPVVALTLAALLGVALVTRAPRPSPPDTPSTSEPASPHEEAVALTTLRKALEQAKEAQDHARVVECATRLLAATGPSKNMTVVRDRGLSSFLLNHHAAAKPDLEAALAADPGDRPVCFYLARVLLADPQNPNEARRACELLTRLTTVVGDYTAQAYAHLAYHHLTRGDLQRALDICVEGRSRVGGGKGLGNIERVQVLTIQRFVDRANKLGERETLEDWARRAHALAPQLTDEAQRGRAYAECARAVYAWQRQSGGRGSYTGRGLHLELFNLGDEASRHALRLAPDMVTAGHVFAMLHSNAGSKATTKLFEAQVQRFPTYLASRSALGNSYIRDGLHDKAIETLRETVRLARELPESAASKLKVLLYERNVAFALANAALAKNRHQEAATHALQALRLGRRSKGSALERPPRAILQTALSTLRLQDPPTAERLARELRAFDEGK